MLRAIAKGSALFGFGRIPGGARFYREMTRNRMGTQGTHVDKLRRVWPGYVEVWKARCGLSLEGRDVWVHEGGWTPFAPLINFLLTGKGGVLTNTEAQVLDRYLARAVNGALTTEIAGEWTTPERRRQVEALRWYDHAADAIAAVQSRVITMHSIAEVPLESASIDLCHSGGALEHYPPDRLKLFLSECHRVLRPGGIASHVFDHRDHLFHADKQWPFLAHLSLSDPMYGLLCGHPLAYHNRLSPAEVARMFEEQGFERIALRRLILPGNRYVEEEKALDGEPGLPRKRLASRFRDISEPDLRTAAAHYLYRRL